MMNFLALQYTYIIDIQTSVAYFRTSLFSRLIFAKYNTLYGEKHTGRVDGGIL